MYNKYYQDELSYLRELGKEFALANPEAAHFVGESSNDPEVERLLEGFSFLTARIRQKLDDEIPELTHSLVEMLWPHYLRPVPSMTVLQFEALPQAAKMVRSIARGTEVQSVPVDGTPCRFRTSTEVTLQPWSIESLTARTDAQPALKLRFRVAEGVSLKKLGINELRLHLAGEAAVSRSLYLCLCRHLKKVTVQPVGGAPATIEGATVRPVGFGADQFLLPFPPASFSGFRLLQEYFAFPAKFMFVDVVGLRGLTSLGDAAAFDLTFELNQLPRTMPPVSASNVLLHCSPAVNLFPHEADPIRLDHERVEYRLRPAGGNPEHFEVYTIDKVTGIAAGTAAVQEYHPFLRFARRPGQESRLYRHRLQPSVVGDQVDVFISLLHPSAEGGVPDVETISSELTCTNRMLPSRLMIGDVSAPTGASPTFAKFRNITRPTSSIPPTLGSDLHWRLLSHLTLNYLSLVDLEALRRLLGLYHFRARIDRQSENALRLVLQGLQAVRATPATRLFQGTPVRGLHVELDLDEEGLGGEGETYLLGTVLNEFFAQYVSLNAFCRLTVNGTKFGEIYQWPSRMGDRILL